MKALDEEMRRRLGELAREERSPLDGVDRQRIVARAGELAPAARGASLLGWGVVAAAALLLAWQLAPRASERWAEPTVGLSPGAPLEASEDGTDPGEREAAAPAVPERTAAAERAPCADAPLPALASPRPHGRDAEAIDLGERARFVLFEGAEGHFETLERCRTAFVLERGRVLVHAQDLAGGELRVRTASADVVVHGTVFDVRLDPRSTELRVAVAEGSVGVTDRSDGGQSTELAPGDALDLREGRAELRSLRRRDVQSLLAAVADRPRPTTRRRPRPEPESQPDPPRGEVVGGVPQVHQPRWTSDP